MNRRWRVILASVAFLGWLSYLGYAALTKNRGPVISRAQDAAARYAVVAEIKAGPDGKALSRVKVVEVLRAKDLAAGAEIVVTNMKDATSFAGEGQYLLLLNPEPPWRGNPDEGPPRPTYTVVGQQRSPGNDLSGVGPPLIYSWTDDVRKQFEKLPRPN